MKKITLIIISLLLLVGCDKSENKNTEESNRGKTSNYSNITSNVTSNVEPNSDENIDYDESKVGTNKVTLYLFYLSTCPHCHAEMEWLDTIKNKYSYLNIVKYEVSENKEFYEKVVEQMDINDYHVPLTIIGSDSMIGYSESKNNTIINLIKKHSTYDNCDVVKAIENNEDIEKCMKK